MTASRALALVAVLGVAGCGSSSDAPPEIVVLDAFTIAGEDSLAVYLTLANEGGVTQLTGAELVGPDRGRVREITLHQTVDRDGLAIMEDTDAIEVAGGTVTGLDPGRAHLMLEQLTRPVRLGDELHLRLHFASGPDREVTVETVTVDEALARIEEEDQP